MGELTDAILEARSGQKFRGLPVSKSYEPTERRGPFTPLIAPDGARKTSRFSLLTKFLASTGLQCGRHDSPTAMVDRKGLVRSLQLCT